jgi:hypothetical protein
MYPTTHLLAETLIDDRLREAEHERQAKAAQSSEIAPRWWRLRAGTTPASQPATRRVGEPRRVRLSGLKTPT